MAKVTMRFTDHNMNTDEVILVFQIHDDTNNLLNVHEYKFKFNHMEENPILCFRSLYEFTKKLGDKYPATSSGEDL